MPFLVEQGAYLLDDVGFASRRQLVVSSSNCICHDDVKVRYKACAVVDPEVHANSPVEAPAGANVACIVVDSEGSTSATARQVVILRESRTAWERFAVEEVLNSVRELHAGSQ